MKFNWIFFSFISRSLWAIFIFFPSFFPSFIKNSHKIPVKYTRRMFHECIRIKFLHCLYIIFTNKEIEPFYTKLFSKLINIVEDTNSLTPVLLLLIKLSKLIFKFNWNPIKYNILISIYSLIRDSINRTSNWNSFFFSC